MGRCGTLVYKDICTIILVDRPRARVFKVPLARYNAKHGSHCSPSSILLDRAEQCLVIGNIMENRHEQIADRHYHEPVMPHSSSHGGTVVSVIFGLFLFALLAVGIIEARQQIAEASVIVVYVVLPFLLVLALASLTYPVWHGYHMKKIERQHAAVDLQAKQEQVRRENEAHQVQMYLAQSRLLPDVSGNYPAIFNPVTYNVVQLPGGNFAQNVPAHYAPHFHYQDTSTRPGQEQAVLNAAVNQPSQEWLLSQLPENQLIVSPGVQLIDGKVVQVSMVDVPHFKLLGASGFGKSCLAGSLLDQACETNSRDIFQVALLDLEHKTSRLFEDRPHVAQVRIGQRLIQMVATNADEVVEYLGYLTKELDRRAALSEQELNRLPILFMYVEEMLSLQYEVIDPKLLQIMFAALTILSVRGRKYGMFLLACMQTDYSTNELKVSQKMFRFRAAAAIDQTAARAAGFQNTELVKQNFQQGKPGQFVIEYPSFSQIVLAPIYDVKRLVGQKTSVREEADEDDWHSPRTVAAQPAHSPRTNDAHAPQAKLEQVRELKGMGWGKVATIEKVWGIKRGGNERWKQAEEEYNQIITQLTM